MKTTWVLAALFAFIVLPSLVSAAAYEYNPYYNRFEPISGINPYYYNAGYTPGYALNYFGSAGTYSTNYNYLYGANAANTLAANYYGYGPSYYTDYYYALRPRQWFLTKYFPVSAFGLGYRPLRSEERYPFGDVHFYDGVTGLVFYVGSKNPFAAATPQGYAGYGSPTYGTAANISYYPAQTGYNAAYGQTQPAYGQGQAVYGQTQPAQANAYYAPQPGQPTQDYYYPQQQSQQAQQQTQPLDAFDVYAGQVFTGGY